MSSRAQRAFAGVEIASGGRRGSPFGHRSAHEMVRDAGLNVSLPAFSRRWPAGTLDVLPPHMRAHGRAVGPRDRRAAGAFALALLGLVMACSGPTPRRRSVVVRVSSDPGRPVAGAAIFEDQLAVAKTDATGAATLELRGTEGDSFQIGVRCPEGYVSPRLPTRVVLRTLGGTTRLPEYEIRCPPTERTMVISVRTEGVPEIPLRYLGREVGRTDASGAAHVQLRAAPGDRVELLFDTSELGDPWIFPKNPSVQLVVADTDEVISVAQHFDRDPPPPPIAPGRPAPCKLVPRDCVAGKTIGSIARPGNGQRR